MRLLFLFTACVLSAAASAANPNVRAITAFVELDAKRYEQQVAETVGKLRQAKTLFEKSGYPVQTVRITTQPFPVYVRGQTREEALILLLRLAELGRKNEVLINIGPAALDDRPDAAALDLLEEIHSRNVPLDASMIVADEKGVHWNTIRAAARHVSRVAKASERSQGTFSFAATALLGAGAPFFPGSWHTNDAGKFSVGLQSADLVEEVFSRSGITVQNAASELTAALATHARALHGIAREVERDTGWRYWGFDPTPAPLKDESIGAAMEALFKAPFGSPGTMTTASVITNALREVRSEEHTSELQSPI